MFLTMTTFLISCIFSCPFLCLYYPKAFATRWRHSDSRLRLPHLGPPPRFLLAFWFALGKLHDKFPVFLTWFYWAVRLTGNLDTFKFKGNGIIKQVVFHWCLQLVSCAVLAVFSMFALLLLCRDCACANSKAKCTVTMTLLYRSAAQLLPFCEPQF